MDGAARVIGFQQPVIGDFIWQGIFIVISLGISILFIILLVLLIRLSLLGIKALKLYIKKNG